ncbi:hypothetical protein HBI56_072610 [Parastagonospora nodorum]|uniref:Uncharacterized protein n=1 Tax=Phaeosphaeria nodorum (strain SN15 / ATCC MYA-4574 / FGSC 10173) TaxID=321614 RepID=A0A7U2EWV1_PHANO|nr:hypothetical protein HBH56_172380 [Parastagonospora nodorum]QRC94598.1 hypothetical protein JI435_406070 [Parastagonospora nodorum SN15]KAH3928326.1 hypothetical protein HBH54_140940 [Parastagonospora nodorum]KAH3945369.1 hypothetical protein HBH53_146470 [Parastagonospora nodorum]KAH3983955.1 hypothetical protein HBH52_057940 [Parastagonospora nodorum]
MRIAIVLRLELVGRYKGISSRLLYASRNLQKSGMSESQDTGRVVLFILSSPIL